MKLKEHFDIQNFIQAVGSCKGEVYFDTPEDHISLSSALSQYVFCMIIQNHKTFENGEIRCKNMEDCKKLQPFAKAE